MRYRQQKKSNTVATKAPLESGKNSLVERIESQGSLLIQDEWNMITQQDLPTEDNRSQGTHGRSASTLNLEASRIPSTSMIKANPYVAESAILPSALTVKKTVIQSR